MRILPTVSLGVLGFAPVVAPDVGVAAGLEGGPQAGEIEDGVVEVVQVGLTADDRALNLLQGRPPVDVQAGAGFEIGYGQPENTAGS